MTTQDDAHQYRLAQANKMIRLGLVKRDESGELVTTPAMDEMDAPIVPDPVDFEAIARQ